VHVAIIYATPFDCTDTNFNRIRTVVNHPATDLEARNINDDTLLKRLLEWGHSSEEVKIVMEAGYRKAREQGQDAMANHLINCADTYEAFKRKGHERGMKLLADHISEVCENHDIEVNWAGDSDLLEQFEQLRSDVAEQVSSIDKNGKRSEADSNHDDSPSIG
jgi:hypothetical protein